MKRNTSIGLRYIIDQMGKPRDGFLYIRIALGRLIQILDTRWKVIKGLLIYGAC